MSEYQTHELKCWPEYFKAVKSGNKTFEVRKFDRPFAVGDTLVLREYDPKIRNYTGQEEKRKISYLFDLTYLPDGESPIYGGYVVLGLRRVQPDNPPLTLKQLREMDGEPVWVASSVYNDNEYNLVTGISDTAIMFASKDGQVYRQINEYEKLWLAYAHRKDGGEG
jgi:hypothetical protein